jgi:DNA polymerase III subunit alpha, Gram-positive type
MTFVVVDIESTSKFPLNAEMLTADFIVLNSDLAAVDQASFKFRPRIWNKDAEEAVTIHGITREMAYKFNPYHEEIRRLFNWLLQYRGYLVAHNNRQFNSSYDQCILRSHALDNGFYFELGQNFRERDYISTHSLAKFLNVGAENYRLDTLCKFFNIRQEAHHNSFDDAKVTVQLFRKLFPQVNINDFFAYERRENEPTETKRPSQRKRQNSKTGSNRPISFG